MKIVVGQVKPRQLNPGDFVRLETGAFAPDGEHVIITQTDHEVARVDSNGTGRYIVHMKDGRAIWCVAAQLFTVVAESSGLTPNQMARKIHARTEFLVIATATRNAIDQDTNIRDLLMKAYDTGFADGELFQRSVSREMYLSAIPPIEPGIDERRRNKLYGNS
jgi:hypothetical protein